MFKFKVFLFKFGFNLLKQYELSDSCILMFLRNLFYIRIFKIIDQQYFIHQIIF